MRLAHVVTRGGAADPLLAELAEALMARGVRLCGTVQMNPPNPERAQKCHMDLRLLPDGPILRISEDRGDGARGCRLDTSVLQQAVAAAGQRLDRGADLVIVNKFGKMEAEGQGFRDTIGRALGLGVPCLLAVNALNLPAYEAFTDGLSEPLLADPDALLDWALEAIKTSEQGATSPS